MIRKRSELGEADLRALDEGPGTQYWLHKYQEPLKKP